MEKNRLYDAKQREYFQGARPDVVALIPEGPNRILELGCGEGKTLVSARMLRKASELIGIDIIPRTENHDELDCYLQGDIDILEIPYPDEYFDVIVCADVLEHLVDPWQVMKRLASLLRPGGLLIASIPNVRNYLLFVHVYLLGSFAYAQEGLLDRGHIRFFCKRDMCTLASGAGLKVKQIHFALHKVRKLFWILSVGLLEQFLVKQYLIVASKEQ